MVVVQILSLFLTLLITNYWPFGFDVMYGIIDWSALFAEVVITGIGYLLLTKLVKKWN